MKKRTTFILGVFAIISIGLGGFAVHQYQEKQKMVEIATSEKAKKVYEDKFKREDPKAFTEGGAVHSYKVDQESLEYNPMGGLMVRLIVNGKQELDIDFNLIDNEDGTYYSAYYTYSPELEDLFKEARNDK